MGTRVCAFTGHRPKSFPWKYNEKARDCLLLKETLATQIAALADRGVMRFLSGMALGVDLWAAMTVLDLRRKNPALELYCILPCEGQDSKWSAAAQELYHSILHQANDVIFVGKEYSSANMLKRNHFLVDNSSTLLAVYKGTRRSGTGATVNYARKLGREIIVINPLTRLVTYEKSNV